MKDIKSIFRVFNIVFWVALFMILLYVITSVNNQSFDQSQFSQWYDKFDTTGIEIDSTYLSEEDKLLNDSIQQNKDTTQKVLSHFHWKWRDYEGRRCELKFSIPEKEFEKAERYRLQYNSFFSETDLYQDFITISEIPLKIVSRAFTQEMNRRGLIGIDRLNFVVSAIQTPPYTYIEMGRCNAGTNCAPDGCCEYIRPFAVYTPTEYIFQKTGDCDTKSLICYALLKSHGVNAALICGDTDGGPHAMLGVAGFRPTIPSRAVRHNGTIFHPWETTNFDNSFQLGNMRMWRIWRNWYVTNN